MNHNNGGRIFPHDDIATRSEGCFELLSATERGGNVQGRENENLLHSFVWLQGWEIWVYPAFLQLPEFIFGMNQETGISPQQQVSFLCLIIPPYRSRNHWSRMPKHWRYLHEGHALQTHQQPRSSWSVPSTEEVCSCCCGTEGTFISRIPNFVECD